MGVDSTVVRIKNARFYAYHGVLDGEQSMGGTFEVDIDLEGNFLPAGESDKLSDTVNYERVYSLIGKLIMGEKRYLIESVARAITREVLEQFPIVRKVSVRVRKHRAPVHGIIDYVEAEFIESRS